MRNIRIEPRPGGHKLSIEAGPEGTAGRGIVSAYRLTTAELLELVRQSLRALGVDEDTTEDMADTAQAQHDNAETSQEQRYDG